jgi:short-subunit dehydrogenase
MGRRVLIIGNSDGIGAAVTRALLARGDSVTGVSRSPSPLQHDQLRHDVLDVTAPTYVELLERLVAESAGFDTCIYCVGIGSELKLPDLSNEARVFDVNLTAMVRTLATLLPGWLERRQGHFMGLSSLADALYADDAPSYSASKSGFSNYLLAMGLKLRGSGVAVTNVRFGFVDTKMAKAPIKPFMISADAAASHVMRALDKRPLQLSVPRTTAALVWAIGSVQALRIRFVRQ